MAETVRIPGGTVKISVYEYRLLVQKAHTLDILSNEIRNQIDRGTAIYNVVDPHLVRVLTGTADYEGKDEA